MAETLTPATISRYRVPRDVLIRSVTELRTLSGGCIEAVLLWCGKLISATEAAVTDLVVPMQTAGPLHFNVPLAERLRLIDLLAQRRELVLMQLHTHPEYAFHSAADDRLAIPQHEGAISIVVPWFAATWDGTFADVSVHRYLGGGRWRHLSDVEVVELIEVMP